ncbi:MAG TPA: mannosyltransferase family protein [Acidimicrobiia bacterium]|nr:mannosyltransferase family protein [Acidimicrobiia bacterium]
MAVTRAGAESPTTGVRLPRALQVVAAALAAVAVHVFAVWTAVKMQPGLRLREELTDWDGAWYIEIARHGYPSHVLTGSGDGAQSAIAFYPLYPAVLRVVDALTPLGPAQAALLVAIVAAVGALVAIDRLVTRVCTDDVAWRAVILIAFAPGAIVLSMAYSEGLFMLFVALCLLRLVERRWLAAGAYGALACLTRPSGLAVIAACVAAAYVEWRRTERDAGVVVAPLLAIAGYAALPLYHWVHAGTPLAWWQTEDRGWGMGFDFGWSTAGKMIDVVQDPGHDFNLLLGTLGVLYMVGGLVALWYWKPPLPVAAYTVVAVGLAVGASQVVSTMRFAMAAFPLAIAYARVLRNNAFVVVVGVSAALMAVLAMAATTTLYTP